MQNKQLSDMNKQNSTLVRKDISSYELYKLMYSIQDWLSQAPGRSVSMVTTKYYHKKDDGTPSYMHIISPLRRYHKFRFLNSGSFESWAISISNDFEYGSLILYLRALKGSECWSTNEQYGDLVFARAPGKDVDDNGINYYYFRFNDECGNEIPDFVKELINR